MNEIKIGDTFDIDGQHWELVSTYVKDLNILMFRFYSCKHSVFMNIRTEEFDNLLKSGENI